MPASSGSRESPVVKKVLLKRSSSFFSLISRSIQASWLSRIRLLPWAFAAVNLALHQHIDIIVGQYPDLLGCADNLRVSFNHVLQFIGGGRTDQAVQLLLAGPGVDLGKHAGHRFFHQPRKIGPGEVFLGELIGWKMDIEFDIALPEGRIAVGYNGEKQETDKGQRQAGWQRAPDV